MQRGASPTYYLLGKKRPGSGMAEYSSVCALKYHTMAVMPKTAAPRTAVLDFQFLGCAYQPPAGDQTCLG